MKTVRYIYWQHEGWWLGYLEEYPEYITQGESIEDLEANLLEINADVAAGRVPSP